MTGRNTVRTPELVAELCEHIESPMPVRHACAMVGIHEGTFYRWMQEAERDDASQDLREFHSAVKSSIARSRASDARRMPKMRPADELRKEQRLYIIRDARGPLKIGVTTDISKRIVGIQNGNPYQLSVVHYFANYGCDAEVDMHRRFSGARLSGEWFEPVPGLLAEIERMIRDDERPRLFGSVIDACDDQSDAASGWGEAIA